MDRGIYSSRLFWRNHLAVPLTVFLILAAMFALSRIDLMFADWLFQLEGGQWILRQDFLFSEVLHKDVARFMKALALFLVALALASHRVEKLRPYRRVLWYLALTMPLSALLINAGKTLTHVDCPWDLLRYGGVKPYVRLFDPSIASGSYGKCFPAGHASGGYALVALYFFFLKVNPRWRFKGLFIGLVAGLLFGLAQQLRGAHFLSHDLWTLAICWFNSLIWYQLILNKRLSAEVLPALNTTSTNQQSDYG